MRKVLKMKLPRHRQVFERVQTALGFHRIIEPREPLRAVLVAGGRAGDDRGAVRIRPPANGVSIPLRIEPERGVSVLEPVIIPPGDQRLDVQLARPVAAQQSPPQDHRGGFAGNEKLLPDAMAARGFKLPRRPRRKFKRGQKIFALGMQDVFLILLRREAERAGGRFQPNVHAVHKHHPPRGRVDQQQPMIPPRPPPGDGAAGEAHPTIGLQPFRQKIPAADIPHHRGLLLPGF